MRRPFVLVVMIFSVLSFLMMNCGGGGSSNGGDDGDDNGQTLSCVNGVQVLSHPVTDDYVDSSSINCYSYSVTPGDSITVGLVGLTGDADLAVLPPETCSPGTTNKSGTVPEYCMIETTQNQITLAVIGNENANYTFFVSPTPNIADPVNETISVPYYTPTIGQVETRGESFYSTSGLTLGTYTVRIVGGGDLHVYSDDHWGFELDCTLYPIIAKECTESFTDTITFSVESPPLDRDGAAYIMLVH